MLYINNNNNKNIKAASEDGKPSLEITVTKQTALIEEELGVTILEDVSLSDPLTEKLHREVIAAHECIHEDKDYITDVVNTVGNATSQATEAMLAAQASEANSKQSEVNSLGSAQASEESAIASELSNQEAEEWAKKAQGYSTEVIEDAFGQMHVYNPNSRVRGSTFIRLKSGTMLAYAGTDAGRELRRSTDEFKTFTTNITSLRWGTDGVFVEGQNGRVFYLAGYGKNMVESGQGLTSEETGQIIMQYSDDDGITWTSRIYITAQVKDPKWKYVLTSAGNGEVMSDGTIIVPISYVSFVNPDDDESGIVWNSSVIRSSDNGETWVHGGASASWANEPSITIQDDIIYMLSRNTGYYFDKGDAPYVDGLFYYLSTDKGDTWIASKGNLQIPQITQNMNTIKHIKHRSRDLFVCTKAYGTEGDTNRSDGRLLLSMDQGVSWREVMKLDDYLAYSTIVDMQDGRIAVLYESGEYSTVTIQFISIPELLTTTDVQYTHQIDSIEAGAINLQPSTSAIRINNTTGKDQALNTIYGGTYGQTISISMGSLGLSGITSVEVVNEIGSANQGKLYGVGDYVGNFKLGTDITSMVLKKNYWGWEVISISWVLRTKLLSLGMTTIKMFGAVGDGIADDTAAIQAAINECAATNRVLFVPDGRYKITETLVIPATQTFTMQGMSSTIKQSRGCVFITDRVMTMIQANVATQIFDIAFWYTGDKFTPNTKGVLVDLTRNSDDMDTYFQGCYFQGFNIGIHAKGRGLLVRDCVFTYATKAIYREWETSDPEFPSGVNNTNLPMGYRADIITGNRFHVLHDDGHAIYIADDIGSRWYRGARITNNTIDLGGGLFDGSGVGLVIANNVVDVFGSKSSLGALHLKGVTSCLIANNTFCGMNTVTGQVEQPTGMRGINISEAVGCTLSGNTFRGFTDEEIYFTGVAGTSTDNVVSNNTFSSEKGLYLFNEKDAGIAIGNTPAQFNSAPYLEQTGGTLFGDLILKGNNTHMVFNHTSHNSGDIIWEWDNVGTTEVQSRIWTPSPEKLILAAGSNSGEDDQGVLVLGSDNTLTLGGSSIYHMSNPPTALDVKMGRAKEDVSLLSYVQKLEQRISELEARL